MHGQQNVKKKKHVTNFLEIVYRLKLTTHNYSDNACSSICRWKGAREELHWRPFTKGLSLSLDMQ